MTNTIILSDEKLAQYHGGISGFINSVGDFVSGTWTTLYESGKDLGRNIYNGWF